MSWWTCAIKKTSPRTQGHPTEKRHCGSYGSNRSDGQGLPSLLSAKGRSCPLLPEVCKSLLFNLTTWNSSIYPPGSLQSPPYGFAKDLQEIFHARAETQADTPCFCLSERMTWQKFQHHWIQKTSLWKWQLCPWSHWEFGSPYTPRSTWGISLHLTVPLKAVQPQYCTAALTGSAEKLKPETARP